ncbi:MAG: cytochrome c [Gammaproteobacteria bacterium]|nr:cytochrome c [Gammaproteobacteria bacterium]
MLKPLLFTGICLSISAPSFANTDHAKKLIQTNCVSCHQADVYKRDNRKVKNLTSLATFVENCNTQTSAGWFPEDVDAVVKYLNANYYKFK